MVGTNNLQTDFHSDGINFYSTAFTIYSQLTWEWWRMQRHADLSVADQPVYIVSSRTARAAA